MFLLCRSTLLKKLPGKILLCLCISISALLITFLAGVERRGMSTTDCKVAAAFIYYFILTTFGWMVMEGYSLYKCFVQVFPATGSNKKTMMYASSIIWGTYQFISSSIYISIIVYVKRSYI